MIVRDVTMETRDRSDVEKWSKARELRGSSGPKDHTGVSSSPALAGGSFTTQPPGKPLCHLMSTYLIGARHPEQWGNTGVHHT